MALTHFGQIHIPGPSRALGGRVCENRNSSALQGTRYIRAQSRLLAGFIDGQMLNEPSSTPTISASRSLIGL